MICNACFGSAVAMDVSGRHGRSIWIFVEISWEKRVGEEEEAGASAKGVISFVTNGDEIWIFSYLADKLIENIFLSLEMVEELGLMSQQPNCIWRASHLDTILDTIKGMNGKDVSKWH